MGPTKKPTSLNYILPLLMIIIGLRHFAKHGLDLWAIIPIMLGVFALYMTLFNHDLLQRTEIVLLKAWQPVGQFITIILLTTTFFIVFAPVGLVLRLLKKDILNKGTRKDLLSYWIERSKKGHGSYTQQF